MLLVGLFVVRQIYLPEFKTCTFDMSSYHNLLLKSFQSLVPYLTNLPDFFELYN